MTVTPLPIALLAIAISATVPANAQDAASAVPSAMSAHPYHAVRASKVIGKEVRGTNGKKLGKIRDLIVNVTTGDIRYAVLEFDPGMFTPDKLFAVPLSQLTFVSDDKPMSFPDMPRERLESTAVDKSDWERATDNQRYINGLDQNFGFKPPAGDAHSIRASKLIGKSVNSPAGKDIGSIKDLVLDVGADKVHYTVLSFDPSFFGRDKLFAFPLTAFQLKDGKEDMVLDVDKSTLSKMRAFDASRWGHLNDLNRDRFVNAPPAGH